MGGIDPAVIAIPVSGESSSSSEGRRRRRPRRPDETTEPTPSTSTITGPPQPSIINPPQQQYISQPSSLAFPFPPLSLFLAIENSDHLQGSRPSRSSRSGRRSRRSHSPEPITIVQAPGPTDRGRGRGVDTIPRRLSSYPRKPHTHHRKTGSGYHFGVAHLPYEFPAVHALVHPLTPRHITKDIHLMDYGPAYNHTLPTLQIQISSAFPHNYRRLSQILEALCSQSRCPDRLANEQPSVAFASF
ncbi:hypothetical protein B0H11DRAFT_2248960 [Mycena galericulata]|nr:hypothetical protein B0H11DRAFT_2248960 [Mycena galericulata]